MQCWLLRCCCFGVAILKVDSSGFSHPIIFVRELTHRLRVLTSTSWTNSSSDEASFIPSNCRKLGTHAQVYVVSHTCAWEQQ